MSFDPTSSRSDLKVIPVLSTEIKNRIVGPDEILRCIDTGALYIAGQGGKPQSIVTAATSLSGGVEFDEPTTAAIAAIAAANGGGGAAASSTDLLKAQHLTALNEQRATMQRDAYNPLDALMLALGRYRPDFGGLLREKLDATWGGSWTFTRATARPAPVFLGTVPVNQPAFGLLSGTAPKLAGKKFDLDLFPFGATLASYGIATTGLIPHTVTADGRLIVSVGSSTTLYRSTDASNTAFVSIPTPDADASRRMQAMFRSPSGAIFASTYLPTNNTTSSQGRLYRSTDNGDTWTLCLDCRVAPPEKWNFSAVGSRILVSQYGPRLSTPPSELAWLSDDDGVTWRQVFKASDIISTADGIHLHFTAIDPNNTERAVITSGDGGSTRRIFVTSNLSATPPTWTQPLNRSDATLRTTSGYYEANGDLILGPDGYGDGGGFDIRRLTTGGVYTALATLPAPSYKMVKGPLNDVWTQTTADPTAPPNPTSTSGIYYSPPGCPTIWLNVGTVDTIPTASSTGLTSVLEPTSDGYLYAAVLNDKRNINSYMARLNLRRVYPMGIHRPGDRTDEDLTLSGISVPLDSAWTMGCTLAFVMPRTITTECHLMVLRNATFSDGWVLTCRNDGTGKQTVTFKLKKRRTGGGAAYEQATTVARTIVSDLTSSLRLSVIAVRRGVGQALDMYVQYPDGGVEKVTATEDANALAAALTELSVGSNAPGLVTAGCGATVAHPLVIKRALEDGEARALLSDLLR